MVIPTAFTFTALKKLGAAALNAGVRDVLNFLLTTYPRCHVYNAAGQSIPDSATYNLMLWDAEVYDTDSMHSTSVNTSRITFTTAGLYDIDAMVCFAPATYTDLKMQVNLNSGGVIGGGTALRSMFYDKGAGNAGPFTFCQFFSAGDYIEVFVSQVSGGAKSTPTGAGALLGCRVFARLIATT
jgi:hypothetical protein